jgi:hypothetical protein
VKVCATGDKEVGHFLEEVDRTTDTSYAVTCVTDVRDGEDRMGKEFC